MATCTARSKMGRDELARVLGHDERARERDLSGVKPG